MAHYECKGCGQMPDRCRCVDVSYVAPVSNPPVNMEMYKLRSLLLERAGVSMDRLPFELPESKFKDILKVLEEIQHVKAQQYGDYIKQQKDVTARLALFDHFVNIRRKFKRAEHTIERIVDREANPDDLLDTYSDLAVYAVLGIMLAYEKGAQ